MRKRAYTSDELRDIRGIGCVIAPNRHPGRSAFRAQSPRYSTRATKVKVQEPTTPIKRIVGAEYGEHTFRFVDYATAGDLAIALTVAEVATDDARTIIEQYRYYLDTTGQLARVIDINTGAGRGW